MTRKSNAWCRNANPANITAISYSDTDGQYRESVEITSSSFTNPITDVSEMPKRRGSDVEIEDDEEIKMAKITKTLTKMSSVW